MPAYDVRGQTHEGSCPRCRLSRESIASSETSPAVFVARLPWPADQLQKAMADYTENGGKGETAIEQEQAVAVLQEKFDICCGLFRGFDYSKFNTGTPEKAGTASHWPKSMLLAQEDGNQRVQKAVGDLSKAFAHSVPHPVALAIRDDAAFFQAVKAALAKDNRNGERPTMMKSRSSTPSGKLFHDAQNLGYQRPDRETAAFRLAGGPRAGLRGDAEAVRLPVQKRRVRPAE